MNYTEQLNSDLITAMKNHDDDKLRAVRSLKARIKEREIELGRALEEAEFLKVVQSLVKQRRESIAAYEKGQRMDLVAQERAELDYLHQFLPQPLGEAELTKLVKEVIQETGASSLRDLGKVMPVLMKRVDGRADGRQVQEMVKRALS